MKPFLLDTVTISEFRRKDRVDPQVRKWQEPIDIAWLSVITLATRNTADFVNTGIPVVNPWEFAA